MFRADANARCGLLSSPAAASDARCLDGERSGVAGRKDRDVRGDVLEGFPIGSEKGELCVN